MSPQNRIILFAVLALVALASMCVEAFILQELPLYRAERNLETAAFERALRSNSMAFNNKRNNFHQQFFVSFY